MRERGHVTAANGVAEVAVFGALQRNVQANKVDASCYSSRSSVMVRTNRHFDGYFLRDSVSRFH